MTAVSDEKIRVMGGASRAGEHDTESLPRINTDSHGSTPGEIDSIRSIFAIRGLSPLGLGWRLLADARADFEGHLAGLLVGLDDDVIAMQDFAVEDLQRQRILH